MENNCCEEKCNKKCEGQVCCSWKRCYIMKYILIVIVIIAAFCMGTQWGQMRASTRGSNYGTGMMNWYR